MKAVHCPICRKQAEPPHANRSFPFCSDRCRLVDLGRWLDGRYVVNPTSGRLEPDEDDAPDPAGAAPEE